MSGCPGFENPARTHYLGAQDPRIARDSSASPPHTLALVVHCVHVYALAIARRRRKKVQARTRKPTATSESDHMARVHVTDTVWTEFRAAAGPLPLNIKLGELVQREVDRYRSRRLREGQLDDQELIDAFERARELHEDLTAMVARLEGRLDRARRGESTSDAFRSEWGDDVDY